MAVEARRHQHQLRPEGLDARQQDLAPGVPEGFAARARRQRRVGEVAHAGLAGVAAVGVQRRLVRAGVHHARLAGEDVLAAVAVVHVEIGDHHPLQPVRVKRVRRGHGRRVEQAEAHRHRAGGMVARRPHGAEGLGVFARHHRVHGRHAGAGGAQRGLGRFHRHGGVFVQAQQAVEGGVEQARDQVARVHAQQGVARRARRLAPRRHRERGAHRVQHRLQPRRALRVPGPGVVRQAGGMGVEKHAQPFRRSWFQSTSPWPLARASTRASTNSRSESRLR